jgi:Putative zinc-finger
MFGEVSVALSSHGVRHEDVQGLLVDYAAGMLGEAEAERVRAHLASGCATCLTEVFGRPVGLPRQAPASVMPERRTRWLARGLAAGVALLAGALGAVLVVGRSGPRETNPTATPTTLAVDATPPSTADLAAAAAEERARLGALLAAERSRLEERSRELEAARQRAAEAEAESQARAVELGKLDAELAATKRRADDLDGRLRALRRPAAAERERPALDDVLESPGARLLQLRPVGPFRDVRGHALWHPGSDVVVVYGFGLPALPGGRTYQVRVDIGSGEAIIIPNLRPDAQGRIVVPLHAGQPVREVTGVRVGRDPGGDAVLASREPASSAP